MGFVVSAIVAFIAVKWLLRYIQTHRFTVFAWYRIVVGGVLLALAAEVGVSMSNRLTRYILIGLVLGIVAGYVVYTLLPAIERRRSPRASRCCRSRSCG